MADVATKGPALDVGLPTVETLADPRLRFTANPHVSGHGGGHETNLRQLAQDGITLVGHLASIGGTQIRFAPDLVENLDHADGAFAERFQHLFDRYIALAQIDAPPDDRQPVDFDPPLIDELDLKVANIGTVLWTTGYRPDFGWIDLPILDDMGLPRQHRGVSDVPGLYFVGLLWQHTLASGTLLGPPLDAPYLLDAMGLSSAG